MAAAKKAPRKQSAATKKTTSSKSTTGKRNTKNTTKSTTGRKGSENTRGNKKTAEEVNAYKDQMAFETGITIIVLVILALFLYLSYIGICGKVGYALGGIVFGFIGWLAWLLPVYVIVGYTFAMVNPGDKRVPRRLISSGVLGFALCSLIEIISPQEILTEFYTSNHVLHHNALTCLYLSLEDVVKRGKFSGGILGRYFGNLLSLVLGKAGATVICIALILLCIYLFYGLEAMAKIRKRNAYHQELEEAYEEIRQSEDYREPSYRVIPAGKNVRVNGAERDSSKMPQPVDLRQAGEQYDAYQQREQENKKRRKKESLKQKQERLKEEQLRKDREAFAKKQGEEDRKKLESAHKDDLNQKGEMKEIIPEMDSAMVYEVHPMEVSPVEVTATEEPIVIHNDSNDAHFERMESAISKETLSPKEQDRVVSDPAEEIPIFREEMNQKFGKNKPMDSFAQKEEVTDVRPVSQIVKEEEIDAVATTIGVKPVQKPVQPKTVSNVAPTVHPVKPATTTNHGRIGGDEYVSGSDTFNALNDSKMDDSQIPYQFPAVDLLSLPSGTEQKKSDAELRQTALRLQETLQSFNVNVQMGPVTCGPTVTRFEVLPEQGVRVNKITNLSDDLKLSLAAQSIRIEAPIPGKSAVGIEVPNEVASSVHFRELLQGDAFAKAKSPVTFAVGKDIAGKVVLADIAKMPHLLIAGATGSGKSVCINTLIMSILYKSDPNDVKLIMIDPKVVELSVYNGIPHLFCPVVTDPKEAAASLNWAVREMMDRYNKFQELGVRNIEGYNKKIKTVEHAQEAGYAKMSLLVIIVDEFADLMMVASKEVEDAVCRLAQLARAAGIHLILATQRPSVNVITGVIKANIPSRIAFSVSSQIDSRTILDKGGAEKLLGKGDMLFFPSGYSEPVRLQGAFVSDKEVSDVVDFLCNHNEKPIYNEKVTEIVEEAEAVVTVGGGNEEKNSRDEYFEDAGRFVIESERAAAGQLQRRFSIGFNRAGRIIDQLHDTGVVGPAVGTKPRQVLMSMEQFDNFLSLGGEAGTPVSEEEVAQATQGFVDDIGE